MSKKHKKRKHSFTSKETPEENAKIVLVEEKTRKANEETQKHTKKNNKMKSKKKNKIKRTDTSLIPKASKTPQSSVEHNGIAKTSNNKQEEIGSQQSKFLGRAVANSVLDFKVKQKEEIIKDGVTLVLFYQYVEPPWSASEHQAALDYATKSGDKFGLTGRMRIAKEGFNCTLTGSYDGVRDWCAALRKWCPNNFNNTEFKFTDNLPEGQRFPKLHAFSVDEIVNYGLAGSRAPPINKYGGCHLEPDDYHKKMAENDTVIIDVRNHYEANIGRFEPPSEGAKWLDPMMRKSTEFPVWLDKPETKEMLRGKQVLMYCTGGIRCERASALLRQKIENEEDTKELGIKGVYQLQGGIDKYFKEFPDGGFWRGKNYVFDKRFAHAPPKVEAEQKEKQHPLGKCEACRKPWDMYRGKRRCPACGVPSLICRECFLADQNGTKKIDKTVRCDLCVQQGIFNKSQIKSMEQKEFDEYEKKYRQKYGSESSMNDTLKRKRQNSFEECRPITAKPAPNPNNVTRLFVGNLCREHTTEETLQMALPGVKYVLWLNDHKTGAFKGSGFVEMRTANDAALAVARNGQKVLGRPIIVKYQPPDGKSVWPPPGAKEIQ